MGADHPGMPEQRAEQQGILPAAWDLGEKLLLLAEEAAKRGGRRHTANCGDGAASHGGQGVYPVSRGRTGLAGGDRRGGDCGSTVFIAAAMIDLSSYGGRADGRTSC